MFASGIREPVSDLAKMGQIPRRRGAAREACDFSIFGGERREFHAVKR
jgi:hypothetical protein